MKNFKNKIFLVLGMLFIVLLLFSSATYAANATISCASTTETNKSITIYVSGSAVQWNLKLMVDGQVIAKSSELENYESNIGISFNGVYTPTTTGTKTVSIVGSITDISGTTIDSFNTKTITVSAPAPVTPSEPTKPTTPKPTTPTKPTTPSNNNTTKPNTNTTTTVTKSNNSKLSSLRVAEGAISPEFSRDVYEYSISVPNDIEKLSIEAITDNSKATFSITGNDALQVGQNTIEVIVTAENGKKATYKIYATRADKDLALTALSVYYINDAGQNTAIPIEPTFSFDTYNYKTEKISYKIKDIKVEAIANKENAKIEILGNEELKNGINTITIKVTYTKEDGQEEQKTYSLTVEKEEEPVIATLSTTEQIKNWFIGAGNAIGNWTSTNFNKILSGLLLISSIALAGLTVYFVYDYKKYQQLIGKLAEYNKGNLMERANVALNPEVTIFNESNSEEDNSQLEPQENAESVNIEPIVEEKQEKVKSGKGKRFKI